MDQRTKKLVKSYLIDYLKLMNPDFKINKKGFFKCPLDHEHQNPNAGTCCHIYPPNSNKLYCLDPSHGNLGNIFDIARKLEPSLSDMEEDDLADYLIKVLDIKTDDRINKLLSVYSEAGFGLFCLQPQGQGKVSKAPVSGMSWKDNISYSIDEWKHWLDNNLGLGLSLGPQSKVVAIDIDSQDTLEKMKPIMGETMTQTTKRGLHFLYVYESIFDNINHQNLRNKGYEMELRANNSYIVVAPTSVEGEKREWNDKPPIAMPKELKEFIFNLIDKQENKEEKQINTDLSKVSLSGLDGCCNDTFVKIGGALRKRLPLEQTEYALNVFNQLLQDPLPIRDIKAMMRELKRYSFYDKEKVAKEVLDHLKIIEQGTSRDLKDSLKYEKKDIEEVLNYLVNEGKIIKSGTRYRPLNKVEWETNFMSVAKPLGVKVPYFEKYARFNEGSMIVLGAATGEGKTSCACNFLRQFIEQGITPYYICTEAGSGFGEITASLGIKEGDYFFKITNDPTSVELEDNAVTILDWLKPKNSEYAKTDSMYEELNDQLIKHKGLLIVFSQLRKEGDRGGEFFAPDMISHFASLVAKYRHRMITDNFGNKILDAENTFWKTEKIRHSKVSTQYVTIPTFFDRSTNVLSPRGAE